MKILKALPLLLAATLAFGVLTPRPARAQVSVNFFYDNLSPYGEWVSDPDYGYCWHPTAVADNWSPYTDGYWAYTDSGWTWVSYEDYGSIVYHYGRWAQIPDEGWVWVPGYTWAPAWVSWRTGGDYIGWAPLPPEARWHAGFGFGGGVDAQFNIGPGFYSFVSFGNFGAPALGPCILPREQNVTIIQSTTNITNITTNNSTVYTGGPNYAAVAARSSRPIPTLKLVRQSAPGANGKLLAHQQGNQLMVYSPKVTGPANGKLPPPPKVAKTITAKSSNGWDIVKDPQQRDQLQSKIKSEGNSGNLSAKPVEAEDLKLNQVAGASATPKPGKGKNEKSNADLENATATGGASAAETPKPKKSKKSKTPSPDLSNSAAPDETPARKSKSKKAKTPSINESTGDDSGVKHSSKNEDLQPFSGGDYSAPKSNNSNKGGSSGESKNKKKKKNDDSNNGQ